MCSNTEIVFDYPYKSLIMTYFGLAVYRDADARNKNVTFSKDGSDASSKLSIDLGRSNQVSTFSSHGQVRFLETEIFLLTAFFSPHHLSIKTLTQRAKALIFVGVKHFRLEPTEEFCFFEEKHQVCSRLIALFDFFSRRDLRNDRFLLDWDCPA